MDTIEQKGMQYGEQYAEKQVSPSHLTESDSRWAKEFGGGQNQASGQQSQGHIWRDGR